jgi:hypothetical protein
MSDKLRIKEIKDTFKHTEYFTVKELSSFYSYYESDLKDSTLRWRVHKLKKNGIIKSIGRGIYKISDMKNYNPFISNKMKSINNQVKLEFPYLDFCIWDTTWLNNYMIHQPNKYFIMLEVERGVEEAVFSFLKERERDVYVNPTQKEIDKYIFSNHFSIVIKTLTSQAPIIKSEGVLMPKVEKILVDLYADKDLFAIFQGNELINIIENINENIGINFSTLFRYADRRKVKTGLTEFLNNSTSISVSFI